MPVIDPQRLDQQIHQCFVKRSDAKQFVVAIKELLEFYSERSYRAGEYAALPSALKSYHVPQPLLRTMKKELARFAQTQPTQAIANAKELWEQPYQEQKELAIAILANLPLEMENELYPIVEQWVIHCTHRELIEAIARQALNTVRLHRPERLIEQAGKWIIDGRHVIRQFGLLVLEEISLSISYRDLPLLFKVISPFFNRCPASIYPQVVTICKHLIQKSPKEMAYLMRKAVLENPYADAKKLIKSCLKTFPLELQSEFNQLIRQ